MRNEEMTKEVPDGIRFSSIQPNAQNDLTFLDALLIISQRKKLVGILTAACTAIALVVAFTLPQEYTATVVILPVVRIEREGACSPVSSVLPRRNPKPSSGRKRRKRATPA